MTPPEPRPLEDGPFGVMAADRLTRDEFVDDHLLRHLPVYINGPLWRCICGDKGDSQPGFGGDGWRRHIGLNIGPEDVIEAVVGRMNVFDELRGMVIDLPVGTILPGWIHKSAVIEAIDKVETEREQDFDSDCPACAAGGHVIPKPHKVRKTWR